MPNTSNPAGAAGKASSRRVRPTRTRGVAANRAQDVARQASGRGFASAIAMVGSLIAGLAASSPAEAADAPKVVASIKPVASLVSAVMEGVGEPYLVVKGAASPHTAALKPSDATALSGADAIFWIGPQLENFLIKPIDALGGKSDVVRLWDADGVVPLKAREGGMFDADDDDHGGAEVHDDHGDDHDHEHGDNPYNEHVWLDPENAAAMTKAIAATLQKLDPDHADTYAANAKAYGERLRKLESEVSEELGGVPHKPFVVFHDAYQYFEHRFDVPASGSITVSPEKAPGAARIREIKDKLASVDAACVFSEPEFEPSVVAAITEGTSATTGVLDPLGANLPDGPDLYPTLIKNIADGLKDCFAE